MMQPTDRVEPERPRVAANGASIIGSGAINGLLRDGDGYCTAYFSADLQGELDFSADGSALRYSGIHLG
jgi:hypothetical protein